MTPTEIAVARQLADGATRPVQIASALGYTPRTVNRALKALSVAGIAVQTRPQAPWAYTGLSIPDEPEQDSSREHDLVLPMRGGYLYAVEFANGVIKVGRSSRPRVRIAFHRKHGLTFGHDVINQWISRSYNRPDRAERELIRWCADQGERVSGHEYFTNLIFSDVIAHAQTIT